MRSSKASKRTYEATLACVHWLVQGRKQCVFQAVQNALRVQHPQKVRVRFKPALKRTRSQKSVFGPFRCIFQGFQNALCLRVRVGGRGMRFPGLPKRILLVEGGGSGEERWGGGGGREGGKGGGGGAFFGPPKTEGKCGGGEGGVPKTRLASRRGNAFSRPSKTHFPGRRDAAFFTGLLKPSQKIDLGVAQSCQPPSLSAKPVTQAQSPQPLASLHSLSYKYSARSPKP